MNMNYMKYERKISKYSFITILISFHYKSNHISMQHLRY